MIIIGAGMAGLIAANLLRRHRPVVYEAQEGLPDNHGALLRFRSDVVAKAVGQRFRCVHVTKAVKSHGRVVSTASLQDSNRYSLKVTGEVLERSIMNLEPSQRWIAPDGFCKDMSNGVGIKFGRRVDSIADLDNSPDNPIISTVPMPTMMRMAGWEPQASFGWHQVWSIRTRVVFPRTNVYQTIYYPDPELPYYRASMTGNQLIIEHMVEPKPESIIGSIMFVLRDFGISLPHHNVQTDAPNVSYQKYGKIIPFNEQERRAFILSLTDRYGIYSLGRFATWRQILLDDIVQDVGIIDRLITERDAYSRHITQGLEK